MLQPKQWSAEWGGRTLTIEAGKLALLAGGSCTVQYGDTVILATATMSSKPSAGLDYFPLMVEFQEKLSAAGKIKGSRFIKREGRPSDWAILTARVIDRAIRPLFDDRVRNEVQVVLTPLCVDGDGDTEATSLIAASAALSISQIPWNGPIGGALIGRKDGAYILNPSDDALRESDLNMIVAGSSDRLVMVEAGAKEIADADFVAAMQWGCKELDTVIDLIARVAAEVGKKKIDVFLEMKDAEGVAHAKELAAAFVASIPDHMIFDSVKPTREERVIMIARIEQALALRLTEQGVADDVAKVVLKQVKPLVSVEISKRILEKDQRLDGRSLTDIRPLHIEVDLLPARVHGSALFMRGDTQVLSSVTLGAPGDVQTLDTMEEEGKKRYMHHYADAPFTYGETGFMRGPGRRAIGHGALAERALEPVLPPEAEFPYAIRVTSEVLGSNGSSSMASTCGSTLSLMAAGVPIVKPVAGIAMGLASDDSGKKWKVLTDLQDVEDGPGGMDFKIAGTADGITAVQMDTKTAGLSWDIVAETISQAKDARLRIIDAMTAVIPAPRADLSPFAPRIVTILIDPEKIRDVIGPGGKVINKIIADTGVEIDIEQDGRVMVTSSDGEAMKKAIEIIKSLTKDVEAGEIYDGKVVRIEDFGAFVSLTPNKDGLVHVSEISWDHVNRPGDVLKMGQEVKVLVKEIDSLGRVNLTMKGLLPKPEGWVPPPPRMDRGPRLGGGGGRKPFFKR